VNVLYQFNITDIEYELCVYLWNKIWFGLSVSILCRIHCLLGIV